MKLSLKIKSILLLIVAAFGYALLNVAVRLMNEGMAPMTQVYTRIFLGLFIAVLFLYRKISFKKLTKIPIKDWIVMMAMGIIGFSLMVYFITLGALEAKLINVSIIYASTTLFVYLYSIIFFKEKIRPKVFGLIFISLIGIGMVAGKSFIPMIGNFGRGEFFVFLSAITGAVYYVGRKALSNILNTQEITLIVMLIAGISSFVIAIALKEPFSWRNLLIPNVIIGLSIGAIFNFVSNYAEIFAFKHLPSVLGSQILLSENLFSPLFGIIFYKEIISLPELVGGILIVSSVYFTNKILG